MGTHTEAVSAIAALDNQYVWEGMETPMVVKWMDMALQRRRREQHLANMRQAMAGGAGLGFGEWRGGGGGSEGGGGGKGRGLGRGRGWAGCSGSTGAMSAAMEQQLTVCVQPCGFAACNAFRHLVSFRLPTGHFIHLEV